MSDQIMKRSQNHKIQMKNTNIDQKKSMNVKSATSISLS